MRRLIVDGIKYQKIGNNHYYSQELFEKSELTGYIQENMMESKKSVFDHVVYDSKIEYEFATHLERRDDVKLYAKLPNWFKINTPLGSYNPDWAVLFEIEGEERLYFVVETKGNLKDLRRPEEAKIKCGKKHFKALRSDVSFIPADTIDSVQEHLKTPKEPVYLS